MLRKKQSVNLNLLQWGTFGFPIFWKGNEVTKKQNIEFIAEYFGYEDDDLDEWKKDADKLTNEQIAGIRNLVKRHKEKRD